VPIYYGAENITEYIPKECFIDFRDFANYEELYQFLKNISEKDYRRYLEAVKDYIAYDKRYYYFTSDFYVKTLIKGIENLTNLKREPKNYKKIKYQLIKLILKNPFFFLKHHKRFVYDAVFG